MPSPTRLLALVAVAGLGLSACTEASPDTPAVVSDSVGNVQADWSAVDVAAAAPEQSQVHIGATAPSVGDLPALAGGWVADPAAAAKATVWAADNVDPDQGQLLDVGGDESGIDSLTTVGDSTYALGYRWSAGIGEPFIQSSMDRESWTDVELPAAADDRGVSLSHLVGQSDDALVALGMDAEDKPVAVLLETGKVVNLPTPDYGRTTSVSAAAASARRLIVLTVVEREDGGQENVAFTSKNAGVTWEPQGSLPGTNATVYGMVLVKGGVVATGYSLRGNDYLAASWFSESGSSWRVETLPPVRGHESGWSSWASAPTVSGGTTYVGLSDTRLLYSAVARRSPTGRWTLHGEMPAWRTPGATIQVVADGQNLIGLRSWNGIIQSGSISAQGRWKQLTESGALATVGWWDTVAQVGDETLFVGGNTNVEVTENEGWSRTSVLAPFTLNDKTVAAADWSPNQIADATGLAAVSDDEGNAFIAAEEVHASDDNPDATDVTGWIQRAGQTEWEPARGLEGPRSEFLNGAAFHAGEWVVVGYDRASYDISDHSYGALWTSKNGLVWKMAQGPFDVSASSSSWLNATCILPEGDLVAVGGAEDSNTGSRPLAFRRVQGVWKVLDVDTLGANVTDLDSCAGSGEDVLFQGSAGGRDALWRTADGKKFTKVDVGSATDSIGTIVAIEGGFVAPGAINEGVQDRAVVWLSSDGQKWNALDVPSDRLLTATDLALSDDGAVVALTGRNGPAIAILKNVDELLQ